MIASLSFLAFSLLAGPVPAPAPTSSQEEPAAAEQPPASSFGYDYVETALAFGDLDGLQVNGSLHLRGPWIAVGRYEALDYDGRGDLDLLSGGVGYVHTLEADLDLVGTAALEIADIDGRGDDDDTGLHLRAGVRFRVSEKVQLAGGVSVRTIFDEDVGADGQALYAIDDRLHGYVGFDVRDESFFLIGLRYGF